MARKTVKKPVVKKSRPRKQSPEISAIQQLLADLTQKGWRVAAREEFDHLMGIDRGYTEKVNASTVGVPTLASIASTHLGGEKTNPSPMTLPELVRDASTSIVNIEERLYLLAKCMFGDKDIAGPGPITALAEEGIINEERHHMNRILNSSRYINDLIDLIANKVL